MKQTPSQRTSSTSSSCSEKSHRCTTCSEDKPCSAFALDKTKARGHVLKCRTCKWEHIQAYRKANPEKASKTSAEAQRRYRYRREFNIEAEQYDRAVELLEGCCQLCSLRPSDGSLAVDYDGVGVRGLLCRVCLNMVRRWAGKDLWGIRESTNDSLILRTIEYMLSPPGLPEET